MSEALGGRDPGGGYHPYQTTSQTNNKERSRQEVRIKFKNHDVQTTISKRATDLLRLKDGNTAMDSDSYNVLKQTALRGKDMQMNFGR